ncbi:MAG: proton-conducting transporter membrane subunit, partial [Akkermansiaceae bacterium]
YSSIANAGFILLGIASWNSGGQLSAFQVTGFYLSVYLLMTFAAFFILAAIHSDSGSDEIAAFEGLSSRNPALALLTTIVVGALAGLPLTAGFFGKLFVFQAAVNADLWIPIALGFVGVAAGFYYYFQLIRAMYWRKSLETRAVKVRPLSFYVVSTLTALIVILGFFPQPIHWLIGVKSPETTVVDDE